MYGRGLYGPSGPQNRACRVCCFRAVCGACFCRAFSAAGGLYRYALLFERGHPFRP